jgi:hypothetical protein
MKEKTEGTISIIVAFFVLISAMFDARISAGVAIIAMVAFTVYKFNQQT